MPECPFTLLIEQSPLEGPFVATVPALPGVSGIGATVEEAASRVIAAGQAALAGGARLLPEKEWRARLAEAGAQDR